jgi:hypothetical protein
VFVWSLANQVMEAAVFTSAGPRQKARP